MPHLDLVAWLFIVWLFAMGGAVGSFLNVVVYRLPLGISLVHPPSRCPNCEKRIAWYDNVPIFGWIALRGRCRQCHNPISARYPIVEAITAAMFGLLAVVELPRLDMLDLYQLYPYHLLLLCTLLCAGLMEYDGNQPPLKLFLPALIVGVLASLVWSELWPTPAWLQEPTWPHPILLMLGITAWVGIAVWTAQGGYAPRGPILGLVCVGLCLGWRAGGVVAAASAALYLLLWPLWHFWPKLRITPSLLLGLVTLLWILAWATLVSP